MDDWGGGKVEPSKRTTQGDREKGLSEREGCAQKLKKSQHRGQEGLT